MMKTRFEELDVAKGIEIILVVLGHVEPGKYLMRFIYSFSLFLFFACSGIISTRYHVRNFSTILQILIIKDCLSLMSFGLLFPILLT